MIKEILDELNLENGSNYKKSVVTKYLDNKLFQRVVNMALCNVKWTYGITMKNVPTITNYKGIETLEWALDILANRLNTRETTGNDAIDLLYFTLESLTEDDAYVLEKVINRDLRINLGKTHFNKLLDKEYKIIRPPYMRCSLQDKLDRIKYPAISDKKEDGTYRSVISNNGIITMGRSGELDNFNNFQDKAKNIKEGVYIGEFLIRSLPGTKNRMKANGLINSDIEQTDMYFSCWDYLTLDEFNEGKSNVPYIERRKTLHENISELNVDNIEVVESKIVNSFDEVQEHYRELVKNGFEGTVLKNTDTLFKDHTSPTQIKMKESAVSEFIITGFQEGEGRLEGTLGAMNYASSDNKVQGKMGGFSDDDRKYIWENQEELIGTIVSVKYNGVTKAKGKDTSALMFANFEELRPEKDTADDLEYIINALK